MIEHENDRSEVYAISRLAQDFIEKSLQDQKVYLKAIEEQNHRRYMEHHRRYDHEKIAAALKRHENGEKIA